MTVLFTVPCLSNCADSQVVIDVSLIPLLFGHLLNFGLRGTESI